MKKIYEVKTEKKFGDTFNDFYFDFLEALNHAQYLFLRKEKNETISITEYSIKLPKKYSNATELMTDLFNGDETCEEYDECLGEFSDNSQTFYIENENLLNSKLKIERLRNNLSQSELAERAKVNLRTLQDYEQCHKEIESASLTTILKLANALKIPFYKILEDNDIISKIKNNLKY